MVTTAAASPAIACPDCKRGRVVVQVVAGLPADDVAGSCATCQRVYGIVPLPALGAARAKPRVERVVSEEAACFFHDANQAASVCDDCGRFLCALCGIDFASGNLCPNCISVRKQADAALVKERMTYDSLALTLTLVPLLVWPFTFVTAPTALGLVIFGWRKPGSLLRRNRWRFVLAGVLATLQIAGWVVFILSMFKAADMVQSLQ